jgi:hypothetical protein
MPPGPSELNAKKFLTPVSGDDHIGSTMIPMQNVSSKTQWDVQRDAIRESLRMMSPNLSSPSEPTYSDLKCSVCICGIGGNSGSVRRALYLKTNCVLATYMAGPGCAFIPNKGPCLMGTTPFLTHKKEKGEGLA